MNQEHKERLKKYLFFISISCATLLFSHISYVYLYHDAESSPIEGWSISEAVIGPMSHLNPLIFSNDYNENIVNFLYRSLLKYDYKEQKLVWDLANCDTKNLEYVECYLRENIFWSNGKPITANDIISTYNIIKTAQTNPRITALLEKTTIEEKAGNIIFRNTLKDVNFISVLMQPIVSKEILDNIGNKELIAEFNPRNGIYSGPYKVETLSFDENLWIQKLILSKNEFYTDAPVFIQRYTYKFFKDKAHFSKHKDLVNVFFDNENIIGDSIPRLGKNNFVQNKYVAVFLNEEKIKNLNLREFILSKINPDDIIKSLPSGNIKAENLYLLDTQIPSPEIKNNNIESIMNGMWYFSKTSLKEDYVKDLNKILSQSGTTQENPDLKHIEAPFNKKYNFISEQNFLITWDVREQSVDEIFINGYKLSWYKKWDAKFYYRLNTEFDNIRPGKNSYRVEFKTWNETQLVEEFEITHSSNPERLQELETLFFEWDVEKNAQRQEFLETEIAKIDALEDRFYYNKDYEKFVLNLTYLDNREDFYITANVIKNILWTYGIGVDFVWVTTNELNTQMVNDAEQYDILIVWLDLGYFNFNIFPYFHSSQSNGWYNFSHIKRLDLDLTLEELKSNILSDERRKELQNKALTLIQERFVAKTIYTREVSYLVDRNIKDFSLPNKMHSLIWMNQSINHSFINSEKTIKKWEKNIFWFFGFLKNILLRNE